ncbi:MAG TPA: SIR2 family protein [Allosphingosinicella sp.]|nr:SIR2 family protein [Allosphingosinicella sp.]
MRGNKPTLSYLRLYYFDDEKLRDFALAELVRAIRSGRLIAFTGAWATQEVGYYGWNELIGRSLEEAKTQISRIKGISAPDLAKALALVDTLTRYSKRDRRFDARVAYSAVAQMMDHLGGRSGATQKAIKAIASWFETVRNPKATTITSSLLDCLRIDRVVTANYDLELERWATGAAPDDPHWLKPLLDCRTGPQKQNMTINRADAQRIVSDTIHRDRPESLIEFALGCPENDRHFFHLHGRADHPTDLIFSYRDYDRLYRRSGLGRVPFEHALRILFAGNPMLFVGLGMTEPELNKTLAEFVGDHPYRRKAPAFLIWNTPPAWRELLKGECDGDYCATERHLPISIEQRKQVFRLDMLHRLGVLTIFTDDLSDAPPPADQWDNLRQGLENLGDYAASVQTKRLARITPARWRNGLSRIKANWSDRIIKSWHVDWGHNPTDEEKQLLKSTLKIEKSFDLNEVPFISVFISPRGSGKTALANELAQIWKDASASNNGIAAMINFNMRIDTDSILSFIKDLFIYDSANLTLKEVKTSRETLFASESCKGPRSGQSLLLILKGIERVFDVNGNPLSAEFDTFLRMATKRSADWPNVKLAVLGTTRIQKYFEGLTADIGVAPTILPSSISSSSYLSTLESRLKGTKLDEARLTSRKSRDTSGYRRSVYELALSPPQLTSMGVEKRDYDLALAILSLMSFIGQPIEIDVLFHSPLIRACQPKPAGRRAAMKRTFEALLDAKLVGEVNPYSGKKEYQKRFAVHLSLQEEIRDRNGLPLSDAILTTAYNMSLYAAQPADTALPEAILHDDLGQLIDWLIGSYKDEPMNDYAKAAPGTPEARAAPHSVASLRAAVSLVRGLYSTAALLAVDRGDRSVDEARDGLLTEHGERLERLINAFDQMWRARDNATDPIGPEALYPDELVWLHNERGVVKLAQGDLYEARFSLDEADRINREYVEFGDESHNWRRITLNQIAVDIERGRLQSAEERMNAVERRLGKEKADHIRRTYLDAASFSRLAFDPVSSYEDILVMALITGNRGLVAHLRGELDVAKSQFERAIGVFQRMDEQRAAALFRRHKASLSGSLGDWEGLKTGARLAAAGAESVRQLDIVYAARLVEACASDASDSPVERRKAFRLAAEALEYAEMSDLHRLSIEAYTRIGLAKMHAGDYDAALENMAEAMATAARYGLTLQKIKLRTLLGRIFIARGSEPAGKALIRNAINGATRIGYHKEIQAARAALAEAP